MPIPPPPPPPPGPPPPPTFSQVGAGWRVGRWPVSTWCYLPGAPVLSLDLLKSSLRELHGLCLSFPCSRVCMWLKGLHVAFLCVRVFCSAVAQGGGEQGTLHLAVTQLCPGFR